VDGTPFGRYRLIELIGRGGMGEVWRAHDTDTDRIVAIKVLPANFSDNADFKQRFRREAHAAARLNTPHVIPIHHYGEIDGRLYVDMRLIEGRDLQAVLADGPLVRFWSRPLGYVVRMWCRVLFRGRKTASKLHKHWCAILGLNQFRW
jgi:serine/threonine protein kinase, bacterial